MIKTKFELWDIWRQDVTEELNSIQGGELEEVKMQIFSSF